MPPKKKSPLSTETGAPKKTNTQTFNDPLSSFLGAVDRVNFFSKKIGMQTLALSRGHRAQVQIADSVRGHYMFASFKSWNAAFNKLVQNPANSAYPHVFEIIRDGWACKPYLDIDMKLDPHNPDRMPEGCSSIEDITLRTQHLLRVIFRDHYNMDPDAWLPDDAFIWLHSPNPRKLSLHLIIDTAGVGTRDIPTIAFRSNLKNDSQGAADLVDRIREMDPQGLGLIVDKDVYTKDRAMRMLGSKKFGGDDGTKLTPLFHPVDTRTFMRTVINVSPTPHEVDIKDASFLSDLDGSPVRLIQVPKRDYVIDASSSNKRTTRKKKGEESQHNLGKRIANDRPHNVDQINARILELLQSRAHPSARPVTPRACVDACRSLVMDFLDVSRATEYGSWMTVGWILRRARMPVDVWLLFSGRCTQKYKRDEAIKTWQEMSPEMDEASGRQLCTFATLMYWAEVDSKNTEEQRERFDNWQQRNAYALTLLPISCSRKCVRHFAYNDDEPSVYGVRHPAGGHLDFNEDEDEEKEDNENDKNLNQVEDECSPHIVTCYIDDNDDVYASCSHPDTLRQGVSCGVPHRRLGPLQFREPSYENNVVVNMRYLQSPPEMPSLEMKYMDQAVITDYLHDNDDDDEKDDMLSASCEEDEENRLKKRGTSENLGKAAKASVSSRRVFGKQLAMWLQKEYRALCVKSPMGTGKSYMLQRLIDEHFKGKNVLIVTYRQTLAYEQEKKLQGCGFVNYLSVGKDEPLHDRKRFPRVICQYDSLGRVCRGNVPRFDLIVLDEVSVGTFGLLLYGVTYKGCPFC